MNRVRVSLAGFTGAPGLTTLMLGSGITNVAPIVTFFNALTNVMPNGLSATIPSSGDQINETNGQITGTWIGTGGQTITSITAAAAYSGSSGACIDWLTSLIVAGRRVQGRTFVVPLTGVSYQSDGTLAGTTITILQNAATALIVALAGELKVFSRPNATRVGAAATVIAARVPDMAAVLRSRRS
jgi:hypothetical protein